MSIPMKLLTVTVRCSSTVKVHTIGFGMSHEKFAIRECAKARREPTGRHALARGGLARRYPAVPWSARLLTTPARAATYLTRGQSVYIRRMSTDSDQTPSRQETQPVPVTPNVPLPPNAFFQAGFTQPAFYEGMSDETKRYMVDQMKEASLDVSRNYRLNLWLSATIILALLGAVLLLLMYARPEVVPVVVELTKALIFLTAGGVGGYGLAKMRG